MDADCLLVGDPLDSEYGLNSGTAYVYARRGEEWIETGRLWPEDAAPEKWFGRRVALEGGIAAVAAWADGGSVYVFELGATGWQEVAKLVANQPFIHSFGRKIALFGNDSGDPVRCFQREQSGWVEGPSILPAPSAMHFGYSVAVSGDRVIVGDPWAPPIFPYAEGRAYVYRRRGNEWRLEAEIAVTAGSFVEYFGGSVAIDGTRAIVLSDMYVSNSRRVLVFDLVGERWKEVAVLSPTYDPDPDYPAVGMALSRGRVAVDDPDASVHVYGELECGAAVEYCKTSIHSGVLMEARIAFSGSLRIRDDSFVLRAHDCVPDRIGLFFYGSAPAQAPFGSGYLSVGASPHGIFRFRPVHTDGFGDAHFRVDFTRPPAGWGPGRILPGSTWYFQFAFRDGSLLASTEGLRVTFCP